MPAAPARGRLGRAVVATALAAGSALLLVPSVPGLGALPGGSAAAAARRTLGGTHLNGGMTAKQEIALSRTFLHNRPTVRIAPDAAQWTPAMGESAVRRAEAWIGIPYSWAAGDANGPTYGADSAGGGWFDSKVYGFDCSGLALYAWAPYVQLGHFAATQATEAGPFHPTLGQLEPGDLIFYSPSRHIRDIGHVSMYAGDGQVIQAPMSGYTVGESQLWAGERGAGGVLIATRPRATPAQVTRAPVVTGISASRGTIDGGATVTITGRGLSGVISVNFGRIIIRDVTVLSSHRVRVTVPARHPGTARVLVSTAWASSRPSRAITYTWIAAPVVDSLSSSSGVVAGGNTVTIAGNHFIDVTEVTVGGVPATGLDVLTTHHLRVIVPPSADPPGPSSAAPVVVTTRYGTSNPAWYRHTATPPGGGTNSPGNGSTPPGAGSAPPHRGRG